MEVTTYTTFRQQLKFFLDKVRKDHKPLVVTSTNAEDVVVISKADYESMEETFYLLKSRANATRLTKSMEDFDDDLGI
jgi:antitoxin YefM